MPEQSHLDEMRAQIRADRERAARRKPSLPPPERTPEPEPEHRAGPLARLRRSLRRPAALDS